jgi:hypothetical protein
MPFSGFPVLLTCESVYGMKLAIFRLESIIEGKPLMKKTKFLEGRELWTF